MPPDGVEAVGNPEGVIDQIARQMGGIRCVAATIGADVDDEILNMMFIEAFERLSEEAAQMIAIFEGIQHHIGGATTTVQLQVAGQKKFSFPATASFFRCAASAAGSQAKPTDGIGPLIVKRDGGFAHYAGAIAIGYAKVFRIPIYVFVPGSKIQTGAEVLVFACLVVTVGHEIIEQGVDQLAGGPAIDAIEQYSAAKNGIATIQIYGDNHRVVPEFEDQRELGSFYRIEVMAVVTRTSNRGMSAADARNDETESGPELRFGHRIGDVGEALVEIIIHAILAHIPIKAWMHVFENVAE